MVQSEERHFVSVIIPTYGRPDLLKESIDSVLKQNYKDFEVVVVDDNNPDTEGRKETEKLMNDFFSKVNQVIYLKHQVNKNGSAARNTGFKESRGEYVCFLDDDDFFLENKIEKQVDYLKKHQEVDAVYCGYRVNGKDIYPEYDGELSKELLLMDYHPVTSSLMFRRSAVEAIKGFDESFIRHQDYEFMLRYFESHRVGFVNDILLDKGQNADENIVRGEKLEELKTYFLAQFSSKIDELEAEDPGIRKKILSRHYSKVFLTHMNHGYYSRGTKIFFKYFFRFPSVFTKDIVRQVKDYIRK